MITNQEIREAYKEDTVGRKYRTPVHFKPTAMDYKEEFGDCVTLKLNEPMSWNQFKGLSDSLKVKYITHLKEVFNVSQIALAKMFNVVPSTIHKTINALNLVELFEHTHMTKTEKAVWNDFLKGIAKIGAGIGLDTEKVENTESVESVKLSTSSMKLSSFTFNFSGSFNSIELINSIKTVIDEGTDCHITIGVYKE